MSVALWQWYFGVCALTIGLFAPAAGTAGEARTKPEAKAGPAEPVVLKEGTPTPADLDLDQGELRTFRVEVPKDAVLMTVHVTRSPLPLDILARKGEPMANAHEAEFRSNPDPLQGDLLVSQQSNPALDSGAYFLAVAYSAAPVAVVHKRPVRKIPFTIEVSFKRAKVDGVLKPGERITSQVQADEGSLRTFVIDVPSGAKTLRIDLDEVSSDLDILARYGEPLVRNEDADNTAISALGRESLVIDEASPKPLKPGRWYVNVVHPVDYGTADFTLYASLSPDPPPGLLVIPPLPTPVDPRRRAIQATVEVATEWGAASGTLVTADGLVLTNYHVVVEATEDGVEKDPVVVAVTLDPRRPPRELYRGRVLAFDKKADLALIEITAGFYHQPLPPGYRFPSLPLGPWTALEIGDPVTTIGFPSVGGSIGRVSVTLTRGVVSGFEQAEIGTLMKTDAAISPGNSGGAALDSQWRLIGVPTSENVDPDAVGRMSYIHPLSLVPEPWRAMIRDRNAKPAGEPGRPAVLDRR